jgi:hypothetical protein
LLLFSLFFILPHIFIPQISHVIFKLKTISGQAPVAHTYNSSYSRGSDQEDHGSKPAQANSSRDPISKTHHKKGLVEWLKVKALSSSPCTEKEKKKTISE